MNQSREELLLRQDALVRALEHSIEDVCAEISNHCNIIRDESECTMTNFSALTYILEVLESAETHVIIASTALKNLNKLTPANKASIKIPIKIE